MTVCKSSELPLSTPGMATGCVESITPICVKKATDPHKRVAWLKKTCVDNKAVLTIYEDKEATEEAIGYSMADAVSCDGLQVGTSCDDPVHVKICVEEEVPVECVPTISSKPANALAGLLPGTSISIQKSNCCSIKVSTSAGDFIVTKDVTGYSTGDFKCPVTVTGVTVLSGTCDLADVIITTQA